MISVVTPFYNTAAYLAECIESVLAQTFTDFEYVLLDNCSTDGSREIAEGYAARDPRVHLHHNPTLLPQVPNYNRALTLISDASDHVKLVQADDTIYPHCLEEMVALIDAHPSVGLVGSYFHHGKVEPADMPHTAAVLSGRDACRKFLLDGVFLFGSPSTLLVRADLVRARVPFYTEGHLHEDLEVCFEILRDHDFGFVPQLHSFLRIDPGSIMGKVASYQPVLLDRLIRLHLYGRQFLTEDEYALHWTTHERRYRQMLADAWLRRREPEFWSYHRRGLATIGMAIETTDLARDAVVVVLRTALEAPGRGMELVRWVRGRFAR